MAQNPFAHPGSEAAAILAEKDAHYAAIGRVAANWSCFEAEIDERSIELGELPLVQAHCLAAQISGHGRKLDAYIAIADLYGLSDTHRSALNKLAQDAQSFAERRNRVVHDTWLLVSPAVNARRFERTAKRKAKFGLVHYPTPKVAKLANEIDELLTRFCKLAIEIKQARDALRETPDEEQPQ